MDRSINVGVILNLVDQFSGRTGRIIQSFTQIGDTGAAAMKRISSGVAQLSNGLDRLGNRYSAFITGAAGVQTGRGVLEMERRLKDLGVRAGQTGDQLEALKEKVFNTANQKDILIAPNQLLDAIDRIVQRTGDLQFASDNMREIALAIRASGAAGADVGDLVSDLQQKFEIKNPKEILNMLDLLNNQGHTGHFFMQDMAQQSERLVAAYGATGRTGPDAVRDFGATMNVLKEGAGGVDRAGMAFEMLMGTLEDAQKRKLLTASGIKIMDPANPKQMRAVSDIIKDLIRKTHGNLTRLGQVFDGRALRGLRAVAEEYNKTGRFDSFDKLLAQPADGQRLIKDAASSADELDASLQSLHTTFKQYAYDELDAPFRKINEAIQNIDPEKMKKIFHYGGEFLAALGGLYAVNKIARGGLGIAHTIGKLTGGKAALAEKLIAQPVFVTNWPGGASAAVAEGEAAAGAAGATRASRLARLGRFGVVALRRAPEIGGIASGGEALYGLHTGDKVMEDRGAGHAAGLFGGMAAGAIAGSVVPIVGTGIGALVGGILGYAAGGAIGEHVGEARQKNLDAGGTLKIQIDQDGKVRADGQPNDSRMNYDVDTGLSAGSTY